MAELEPEVKAFEPSRALIAPVERVQLYRTLCEVADQLTGPDGLFAMETAGEQELKSTFVRGHTSFESAGYERDHRGVDRIFVAQTA